MHTLWFEFVLALRRLGRRPAQNGLMLVTFAVSVTLALLSWTLFQTVFLSQPAFDPKGEYWVLHYHGEQPTSSRQLTLEEFDTLTAAPGTFADVAGMAFYSSIFIRTDGGEERVLAAHASARALQLVGAKPRLGRLFTPEEDKYEAPGAVLISEKLWVNGYASDPAVLGKPIELNGRPATIVGVMPREFRFPNDQDMWVSLGACYNHLRYPLRTALVRLQPGVTKIRAEQNLQQLLAAMPEKTPARERGARPVLTPYRDFYLQQDTRTSAAILFALSVLFLAVSCANAANLMLIDFLGRRPEVAATLALGIPRRAAVRNVCWQVAVVALAAAGLSLAVLPWAGPLLFERIKIINAPYWLAYQFTWSDAGMALLLAGVSAAMTLIAPVVYLLMMDPDKIMRDHAYASRGSGRAWWRRFLLTGQVALLTVLGVSAGLLVQANQNVAEVNWGYDAARVFDSKISVLSIQYEKDKFSQGRLATHLQVLAEVRRRAEARSAAIVENPSGYSGGPLARYALEPGSLNGESGGLGEAFVSRVSDGYFATLGVAFVAGQDFAPETSGDGPAEVILNESLARRLWPAADAIGQRVYQRQSWQKETAPPLSLVVRGVVRDFQACGPRAKTNDAMFTAFTTKGGASSAVTLYVRDHAGVATFQSINDAVHRANPRAALYFPSTIKRQVDLLLSSMRMTGDLTAVFAAAAMLLGAIGIYSLTVAQVLQSSREFGIRMALGAEPARLWADFTRGHLLTALIGVGIGLVGASQVARVLGALLFGVDPHGVVMYAGVAATILAVAVLACVPSLWRLRRINPADCLRSL